MRTPTATILAASLVWGACTLGTSPDQRGDAYALTTIGGAPLPLRVGDETWLADTIRLETTGEWNRVAVVILHGEGTSPEVIRRESHGVVTRQGDRIVLNLDCGRGALCIAPDTLRPAGQGFVRQPNLYGVDTQPAPEFRYDPIG